MWHALTSGEPDANIELVFSDIVAWLDKRSDLEHKTLQNQFLVNLGSGAHVVRSAPTTPLMNGGSIKKQQKPSVYGKYLCGLKGPRMHHHSSM